jgi:methionine sulfoxide reductase heme-binding subunit
MVFVLALAPLMALIWGAVQQQLGANPAEYLIRATGDWSLRLLCVTLAITPLRVQFGWAGLARFRRMLGLLVYAYAVLHFLCYAWFDMGWDGADISADLIKRPFILVGFVGWCGLSVLALTSWSRLIRWLGGKRWQALHKTIYAIAGLALLHFFWMRSGKNDTAEVAVYAVIVGGLLGWRVWHAAKTRRQ